MDAPKLFRKILLENFRKIKKNQKYLKFYLKPTKIFTKEKNTKIEIFNYYYYYYYYYFYFLTFYFQFVIHQPFYLLIVDLTSYSFPNLVTFVLLFFQEFCKKNFFLNFQKKMVNTQKVVNLVSTALILLIKIIKTN